MNYRERDIGVDFLRIIATLMVLALHILGQGGLLAALEEDTVRFRVCWFLETACYCAVNCYGLISGYVGYRSRFSYTNILRTWLQVIFYTVGASVCLHFFLPNVITAEVIKTAFAPVSNNKYWYYTAYFCISFFIPALNHLLNTLPRKQLLLLVLSGTVLFSIYPTCINKDLFYVNNGYSALWLIYLYILGGYLAKYPVTKTFSAPKAFLICLAVVSVTFLQKLNPDLITPLKEIPLLRSHSPTLLACAVFLLVGLVQCEFPKFMRQMIAFLAPLTFGVYLLHAQGTVYSNFMKNRFGPLAQYHTAMIILIVFATAAFWFALGVAIDWVRGKLFALLRINQLIKKLKALEAQYLSSN